MRNAAIALVLLTAGCATSGGAVNASSKTHPPSAPSTAVSEEPAVDPSPEPPAPLENAPVPIGTVQTFSNDDGAEWTVTTTKVRVLRKGVGEYADKPESGFFVVAEVFYAVTTGSLEINGSLDFHCQSPDGTQHEVGEGNAFSSGIEPTLDSQVIPTGRKLRSNVVFDVPTPHGFIDYSPQDEPIASWKF